MKSLLPRISSLLLSSAFALGLTAAVSLRAADASASGAAATQGAALPVTTSIDKDAWREELKLHSELFDKLAYRLPQELVATKAQLEKRLAE